MKKHIYKLVVGLLVGTTVLGMTGCSRDTHNGKSNINEKVPMGCYIEEHIEMPKEIKVIIDYNVKSNGTMEVYGYDSGSQVIAYTSKDGEKWKIKDVLWLNELVSTGNRVQQITYNEKGEGYVFYHNQEFKPYIGKMLEDNRLESIPYEVDEGSYISHIKVTENGDIFIGMNSGVARINETDGSVITEYIVAVTDGEFAVVEDQLMVIDAQRGGIVVFNLESGNEEAFIPYEGDVWGSKLLSDDEGSVYVVNSEGISRLAPGGSIWENIVEGNTSAFGIPSLFLSRVGMKDNDEFIVVFSSKESGDMLLRYRFDPNTPVRRTTQVNLYMLEDNTTIREAIAAYQRQNQEVLINVQVGISEGDAITKSDAIRTLNTQLLAGKGPDILILDGLPVQSYVDKGVLLDMSDWVEDMKDSGQWVENITEMYREADGSIYALPTRFTIPTLWGNAEIVNGVASLEELADWAKANPDKKIFNSTTPEELIKKFYGITAHQWMDKKGQINEEAFAVFLESIKTLVEQSSTVGESENSPAKDMAQKEVELYVAELASFYDIPYLNSAIIQRGDGDFGLALDKDGGVYGSVGIVGINANSENQDIAREVVKLAMSKEVQIVDLNEGFPINKEALEEQAKINKDAMMTSQVEKQPETQAAYTKLKEQVGTLNIPAMIDEVFMDLMIEETKGYFHGEKTASEAAVAVAKRTKTYFLE